MKKETIKSDTGLKPLTVFQTFANWLAVTAGERDDLFECTVSDRAIVIVRTKLKEVEKNVE